MNFEVYKDAANELRWRLRADNGKTIADSGEGYKEMRDCLYGISLVRETNHETPTLMPEPDEDISDAAADPE